jgi:hypothetical protein
MNKKAFSALSGILAVAVLTGCTTSHPPTVIVKEITAVPAPTVTATQTKSIPAPTQTVTTSAPAPTRTIIAQPLPQKQISPWTVVSEYYSNVTSGDYWDAWNLLSTASQNNQGGYNSFVHGYSGTGTQVTYFVSSSGDTVTYYLESDNPDGTVQWYSGTATVWNGVIQHTNITQLAGNPNA